MKLRIPVIRSCIYAIDGEQVEVNIAIERVNGMRGGQRRKYTNSSNLNVSLCDRVRLGRPTRRGLERVVTKELQARNPAVTIRSRALCILSKNEDEIVRFVVLRAVVSGWSVAQAQNVTITPLGSQQGEFCVGDIAQKWSAESGELNG